MHLLGPEPIPNALSQIHLAAVAKIGTGRPRRQIEGKEPRIVRRHQHPRRAGPRFRRRFLPGCHGSAVGLIGVGASPHLGIEAPQRSAG